MIEKFSVRELSRLAELVAEGADLHERLTQARHATDTERREYRSDAALLRALERELRLNELVEEVVS